MATVSLKVSAPLLRGDGSFTSLRNVAAEPALIGEAQTALQTVRQMRALLASEGWTGMEAHLRSQRDKLAAEILDNDGWSKKERELIRARYKVFRDLVTWPEETLNAQLSVLQASRDTSDTP